VKYSDCGFARGSNYGGDTEISNKDICRSFKAEEEEEGGKNLVFMTGKIQFIRDNEASLNIH
jgi:hypothetical protein